MTDDVRVGFDFTDEGLRYAILWIGAPRIETLALGRLTYGFPLRDALRVGREAAMRLEVVRSIREAVRGLRVNAVRLAFRPPLVHSFVSRADTPAGLRSDAELLGLLDPGEEAVLSADPLPPGSGPTRYLATVTRASVLEDLAGFAEAVPGAEPFVVSAARAEAEVLHRAGLGDGWTSVLPPPESAGSWYPAALGAAMENLVGLVADGRRQGFRAESYTVAVGAALLG